MFITKKHLSRRTVLEAPASACAAAAGRDDSGGHRARADRGAARSRDRIHLLPARRHHEEAGRRTADGRKDFELSRS